MLNWPFTDATTSERNCNQAQIGHRVSQKNAAALCLPIAALQWSLKSSAM
jgi:hypothetical protein